MMQIKSGTRLKAMVACGLAGALAAGIASARLPKRYESIAVLRGDTSDPARLMAQLNAIQQEVLSRHNLERVIIENDLYRDARKRQPIEDIVRGMREDMFIRPVGAKGPHGVFRISYKGKTADGAQAVTRALTAGFIDLNVQRLGESRREGADQGAQRLELLDPPSIRTGAAWPYGAVWVAIGLAGGALVGLGAGGLLHRLFAPARRNKAGHRNKPVGGVSIPNMARLPLPGPAFILPEMPGTVVYPRFSPRTLKVGMESPLGRTRRS